MKYVVNHPYNFRKFDPNYDEQDHDEPSIVLDEDDQKDGLYFRVFYAFMIGFMQTFMGIILEFMSVLYLCSKDSFRLILMSYATIACISCFDDLYS